jgi:hypothetical protein
MHRLHGLPLAVVEETFEVLRRRGALRMTREAVCESIRKRAEPLQERSCRLRRHASGA